MSVMAVRVQKANLGTDIKHALVARAIQYGTATGEPPDKPFVTDFVVPAGVNQTKMVECPPGQYRVEVLLPSGDVLSQEVVISLDQVAHVDLKTGGSSQNWLSWQTLSGIVPTKTSVEAAVATTVHWVKQIADGKVIELPTFEQLKSNPAMEAVANAIVGQILEAADPRSSTLAKLVTQLVGTGKVTWRDITNAVGTLSDSASESAVLHDAASTSASVMAELHLRKVGSAEDALAFWRSLGRSSAPIARNGRVLRDKAALSENNNFYHWRIDASGGATGFDAWALVRHEFGTEIARLPRPWRIPGHGSDPVPLEILVDRRATVRSIRTTLTVADPELGGLLSYMTAGTLAAGLPVLRELIKDGIIENALRRKHDSPLAACAAGYCAIATGDETAFERWKPWIKRLMTRYPTIPDGAVIYAKRLHQAAENQHQVDNARKAYLAAFRRGLPFFAAGVQLLQDGLFAFSGTDQEAKQMYRAIQQVTTRLDPGQPFTVLRYPKAPAHDLPPNRAASPRG